MRTRLAALTVAATAAVASCSGGTHQHRLAASAPKQPTPAATTVAVSDVTLFAPESLTSFHATKILLGDSDTQIGAVTRLVGEVDGFAEVRAAFAKNVTLHANMLATVCDNVIRINPGTSPKLLSPQNVITLVHTDVKRGTC